MLTFNFYFRIINIKSAKQKYAMNGMIEDKLGFGQDDVERADLKASRTTFSSPVARQ